MNRKWYWSGAIVVLVLVALFVTFGGRENPAERSRDDIRLGVSESQHVEHERILPTSAEAAGEEAEAPVERNRAPSGPNEPGFPSSQGAGTPAFDAAASVHTDTGKDAGWRPARSLPAARDEKDCVKVSIVREDENGVELAYAMPNVRLVPLRVNAAAGMDLRAEDPRAERVVLGNAPLSGATGKPVLPVVPAYIVLPVGRALDTVEVTAQGRRELPGKHMIEHGRKPVPFVPPGFLEKLRRDPSGSTDGGNAADTAGESVVDVDGEGVVDPYTPQDPVVYRSIDPYPGKLYEVVGVQKKRGVSVVIVRLNPVEYIPAEGAVACYDRLTLKVTTKPAPAARRTLRYRPDPMGGLRKSVENVRSLDTYQEGPDGGAANDGAEGGAAPLGGGICDPADSYQYVVVTGLAIKSAATTPNINDLVAHKQAAGLSATIVAIEDVLASYPGEDQAEQLREFIIDAYNNWETDFVLLGGDTDIIPLRQLHCATDPLSDSGCIESIPSDLYYQCLDGCYNFDGDLQWGEITDGENGDDVDLMTEVYIGRASAENADEMANFVYKTLAYENEDASAGYLRNALMVGEHLGNNFGPGICGFGKSYMEEIRLGADSAGYTTVGFAANTAVSVDTLYDYDGEWSEEDIIGKMNAGTYGIYNHLGHAYYQYVMKFYNPDADALINTRFFFANSQGCMPGGFDRDCMAEHLTTSTRHGAFAVIFNSRYGWGYYNDDPDNMDGPSQRFQRQFWHAYFGKHILNLGALNADSHEDNLWGINDDCVRWCYFETNLHGDPHTPLRAMSAEPVMLYDRHEFADGPSGGDGDGMVNPGEMVDLAVTVKNVGLATAEGVTATLASSDPYVSVTDTQAAIGDVPGPGMTKAALDPFTVLIDAGCPTPHEATFDLTLTDSASNTWTDAFTVTVYTSYLLSGTVTLDGAPLEGATVEYTGGPTPGSTVTDATGSYSHGVADGTYSIRARVGELPFEATEPVDLTFPPARSGVDFAFTTATISGTVTGSDTGDPIQGVTIEYDTQGMEPTTVTTGADGTYAITYAYGGPVTWRLAVGKPEAYPYPPAAAAVTVPPDAPGTDFVLGIPEMEAAPASLDVTAASGETPTRTITVANIGGSGLDWQAHCVTDAESGQTGSVLGTQTPPYRYGFHGPVFDGTHLIIGGDINNPILDSDHLWKLDPETMDIVDDLDLSAECGMFGYCRLAGWDGRHVWVLERLGTGDHIFHALDWDAREIVRSLELEPAVFRVLINERQTYGAAYAENALWILRNDTVRVSWDQRERAVFLIKIDPHNGEVLRKLRLPDACVFPEGVLETPMKGFFRFHMCYANGAFWVLNLSESWDRVWNERTYFQIDPEDGEVISSFPLSIPCDEGYEIKGMCHDGRGALLTMHDNGTLYRVDTGRVVWMSARPEGGSAAGSRSGDGITVTFDADRAGPGMHAGAVRIHSVVPSRPVVSIPVTFHVDNGAGGSNAAPVITDASPQTPVTMAEAESRDFQVAAIDADNDPLAYRWLLDGTHVPGASGPGWTYEAGHAACSVHGLSVIVEDDRGGAVSHTWVVRVDDVNRPPVAQDMQFETACDEAIDILALRGSDPDGDTLICEYTQPFHGVVAETEVYRGHRNWFGPDKVYRYTPDGIFTGEDSFTFTVRDGKGGSDMATVRVNVGRKDIGVSPASLDVTAQHGTIVSRTLTLDNAGDRPLKWSALFLPDEPCPGAGEVLRTYSLNREVDYPGVVPFSMTFDGAHVWIYWQGGSWDPVLVYKYDPDTFEVIDVLDLTATLRGTSPIMNYTSRGPSTWAYGRLWKGGGGIPYACPINSRVWGYALVSAEEKYYWGFTYSHEMPYGMDGLAFGEGLFWHRVTGAVITFDAETEQYETYEWPNDGERLAYDNGVLWDLHRGGSLTKRDPKDGREIQVTTFHPRGILDICPTKNGRILSLDKWSSNPIVEVLLWETGEWTLFPESWGKVAGNSSRQVTVNFDTARVGLGTHSAQIRVRSDDPDEPEIFIPVTLTVQADPANQAPRAVMSASPTSGNPPLEVTFDAGGSSDPDGTVESYRWSFGDGATDSGVQVVHTYESAGIYTAVLTVMDDGGLTDTVTVRITVLPLDAHASADPASGQAPLAVQFTGEAVGGRGTGAHMEQDGRAVMEATHFTSNDDRGSGMRWRAYPDDPPGYVWAGGGTHDPVTTWEDAPELRYEMMFTTPGTYHIWMRVYTPSDIYNSAWVGIDGTQTGGVFDDVTTGDGYHWVKHTATVDVAAGSHTFNLRRRERKVRVDRILMTADAAYVPADEGPGESPRAPVYAWSWDFGDGSPLSGEQNPLHTYVAGGSYTAMLTVSDGVDSGSRSVTLYVNGELDVQENVGISRLHDSTAPFGLGGYADTSEYHYNGMIDEARMYDKALSQAEIRGLMGGGGGEQRPTAVVTAEPQTGDAPLAVDFDGSGSTDSDGIIVSYGWGFGDGSPSGSGDLVTHTYDSAGVYPAMLTVTDDEGLSDSATVTITVTEAGNNPPVAVDDTATTDEATPVTIDVLANDSDPDGDALTVSDVSNPSDGSAVSDGTVVTYTPNVGFTGTDSFTYTVSDGELTDTAVVTVTVTPAGETPEGLMAHWKLDESSGITAADSSRNGNEGTLNGNPVWAPGKLAGALQLDGNDRVLVPTSESLEITEALTLACWMKLDLMEGRPQLVNKKAGWSSAAGYFFEVWTDTGLVKLIGDGRNTASATVELEAGVWHHYAVTAGGGTAQIYYDGIPVTMSDATMTLSQTDTADLKLAGSLKGLLDDVRIYDSALSAAQIQALVAGDNPPPEYTITASSTMCGTIDPSGAVTVEEGASLTFTMAPNAGCELLDVLVDGESVGAVSSYTFENVTADHTIAAEFAVDVNDPPNAVATASPTSGYAPLTVVFDGSGSYDEDGTIVDWEWDLDGASEYGEIVTHTFTAPGTYTVTLYVFDDDGASDSAPPLTIEVTLKANVPPVAENQSVTLDEDTSVAITLTAQDADGDALTFSIVDAPGYGELTGSAPNVTYTPDADYYGSDSFSFRANDGKADSNLATVSITVNPVNDAPVARDSSAATAAGSPLDITLRAYDVDEDVLTYVIVEAPANGALSSDDGDSLITYTPDDGFTGEDTFTFTANDGVIDSNVATVTVSVMGDLVSIAGVSTGKSYSLATVGVGSLYYIDRGYVITDLAAELDGMVLVRTANGDKYVTEPDHLTLRIGQEAVISVCYDKRWSVLPGWLDDGTWTYQGSNVTVTDLGASPMEVFEKTVAPGDITLGGNRAGGAAGARSNYVVVVRPAGTIAKLSGDITRFGDLSCVALAKQEAKLGIVSPKVTFVVGPVPPDEWIHTGDSDGDGLSNAFEISQGLDPENADTDSDGVFDEYEEGPEGMDFFDLQLDGFTPDDPGDPGSGGGGGGGCFVGVSDRKSILDSVTR